MAAHKKYFLTEDDLEIINKYAEFRRSSKKTEKTITSEMLHLKRLANFLGKKNLKDATKEDLQAFFRTVDNLNTHSLLGTILIQFYRWICNTYMNIEIERRERPPNMKWFEHATEKQKRRVSDPDKKKFLITKEEYQEILDESIDPYGMWKALWETMYLSGTRPSEVRQMKYRDVEVEGNIVIVVITHSKTVPRKIPLLKIPNHLIRWLENHPNKGNLEAPLWMCLSNDRRYYKQPLTDHGIINKFTKIKKSTGIKKTLTPHCFRKTRATIMFSDRTKDGGVKWDNKELADFFGWTPETVEKRRKEYDLRDFEDLKRKVFDAIKEEIPTYDTLKVQHDIVIEKQQKEIDDLKNQLEKKAEIDNFVMDSLSLIAKEMVQKQGVEAIKELFRKHNVPLAED